MKKYLFIFIFFSAVLTAQQPIEVDYEVINREFQKELLQIFQNFTNSQSSQGNQVIVSFYDNYGELRVSTGSASAPSFLRSISDYKVQFMKNRQLTSTKGVFCTSKDSLLMP